MSDEHDPAGNEIGVAGRSEFHPMHKGIWSMKGMTDAAFRLYGAYQAITGDTGSNRFDDDRLLPLLGMCREDMTAAQKTLISLGLIRIEVPRHDDDGCDFVLTVEDTPRF